MKIIHSQRKTIALIIEPDGSLTIRAPLRYSKSKIEQLIAEKQAWIMKHQELAQQHFPTPHRYQEGEQFYYLGRLYRLEWTTNQSQPIIFQDDFKLDRRYQDRAREVFTAWYRAQTRQLIQARLPLLASRFHLEYKSFRINSARTRWGSCSNHGSLNFTDRLVMLPPEASDYVIAHELAHLKYHNHSAAFWEYLEKMYPGAQARRKWLRGHGEQFNY